MVSFFRMIAATKNTVIAADKMGKIKTTFQDVCIAVFLIGANFPTWIVIKGYNALNILGFILFGLSVVLTIWSGIEMFIKNKSVLKSV